MRTLLSVLSSRFLMLVGGAVLAISQVACAHPVVVQPGVAVRAHPSGAVYAQVYGQVYSQPPVVVTRAPLWLPPPRVVVPMPGYGPGWHGGRWLRREHHHGQHGR
jgi:hypothetical protein